jgi:hypothetical protein
VSFVTASTALPRRTTTTTSAPRTGGLFGDRHGDTSDNEEDCDGMITIKYVPWNNTRFPLAHTCFDRLDLPEYDNEAMLLSKLMWCLDNLEMSGFGES